MAELVLFGEPPGQEKENKHEKKAEKRDKKDEKIENNAKKKGKKTKKKDNKVKKKKQRKTSSQALGAIQCATVCSSMLQSSAIIFIEFFDLLQMSDDTSGQIMKNMYFFICSTARKMCERVWTHAIIGYHVVTFC